MEIEEPFKIGVLFTPPQSFLRKSWIKRFCALYNASNQGIQRLEVFDNDAAFMKLSKSPSKIIPLTDCVKVTPALQKQQANVFEVCTKSCSHQFSADSFQEMTEWLAALQTVSFGPVFTSCSTTVQHSSQDVKQEENMLYSSMDEPKVYTVKSLNTEAMLRNKLHGDYKLVVTSVSIALAEDKTQNKMGKTILSWPYRHIRRYGCSKDNFSFEAGRKCASGEGLFAFSTADGSVIFQSVDSHVSSLKFSHNEGDMSASPFLDDDKSFTFPMKENIHKTRGTNCTSTSAGDLPSAQLQSFEQLSQDMSEKLKLDKEKSVAKAHHPVSKPPRKSKPNTYTNVQKTDDNFALSTSGEGNRASLPNIYENPIDSIGMCPTKSGGSSKPDVPTPAYEPIYAVLEAESTQNLETKPLPDNLKPVAQVVCDNSNTKSKTEQVRRRNRSKGSEDCYDHLSLTKFDNTRTSLRTFSSDHIYGKLLSNRPASDVSDSHSSHTYGSLKTEKKNLIGPENAGNKNHCYTNVHVQGKQESCDPTDNEPKHVLQNNAEYARVFKNRK